MRVRFLLVPLRLLQKDISIHPQPEALPSDPQKLLSCPGFIVYKPKVRSPSVFPKHVPPGPPPLVYLVNPVASFTQNGSQTEPPVLSPWLLSPSGVSPTIPSAPRARSLAPPSRRSATSTTVPHSTACLGINTSQGPFLSGGFLFARIRGVDVFVPKGVGQGGAACEEEPGPAAPAFATVVAVCGRRPRERFPAPPPPPPPVLVLHVRSLARGFARERIHSGGRSEIQAIVPNAITAQTPNVPGAACILPSMPSMPILSGEPKYFPKPFPSLSQFCLPSAYHRLLHTIHSTHHLTPNPCRLLVI